MNQGCCNGWYILLQKMLQKLLRITTIFIISIYLSNAVATDTSCDIVIAGGTLASLGAVIQAPTTLKVCLVEPTARMGGQLGEEGVWHIDFNWLYQPGYPDNTTAYNHQNLHPFMRKITQQCQTGNCWVSRNCFLYSCIQPIIEDYLAPRLASGNLTIYYNATIVAVSKLSNKITDLTVVKRTTLKEDCRTADLRIKDWYNPDNTQFYNKQTVNIRVNKFVIEATQYGDVLVLAKAPFMQGIINNDQCGQSIVFCFHQQYSNQSAPQLNKQLSDDDDFSLGTFTIDQVWRYRRLLGQGTEPKVGEVSLQNWNGPGNDYRNGYIFLPKNQLDTASWQGGLNFTTVKQAQARSLRFHEWFKAQSKLPLKITNKYFQTCNGMAPLPYLRDGRRSVGYKNFMIRGNDVTGTFIPEQRLTGTVFEDRLSLGFYNMDLHSIKNCTYEPYPQQTPLPFFLPARAFTNSDISNLIVSGRAMAQDFYSSMATRTHVTQLSSGVAAILMATYMSGSGLQSTWQLLECGSCVNTLQAVIRGVMPLEWTIAGKKYPNVAGEAQTMNQFKE